VYATGVREMQVQTKYTLYMPTNNAVRSSIAYLCKNLQYSFNNYNRNFTTIKHRHTTNAKNFLEIANLMCWWFDE